MDSKIIFIIAATIILALHKSGSGETTGPSLPPLDVTFLATR